MIKQSFQVLSKKVSLTKSLGVKDDARVVQDLVLQDWTIPFSVELVLSVLDSPIWLKSLWRPVLSCNRFLLWAKHGRLRTPSCS